MTTPSVVLPGYPPAGYPPTGPGRVPPLAGPGRVPLPPAGSGRVPLPPAGPGRVPPRLDLAGYPPPRLDLAGYPRGVCPMAFWEMLQNIMGYGYPPPVDRQKDRHVSKHYFPVVLRTRAVTSSFTPQVICQTLIFHKLALPCMKRTVASRQGTSVS